MKKNTHTPDHYNMLFSLFQASAVGDEMDEIVEFPCFKHNFKKIHNLFYQYLEKNIFPLHNEQFEIDEQQFQTMDKAITKNANKFFDSFFDFDLNEENEILCKLLFETEALLEILKLIKVNNKFKDVFFKETNRYLKTLKHQAKKSILIEKKSIGDFIVISSQITVNAKEFSSKGFKSFFKIVD